MYSLLGLGLVFTSLILIGSCGDVVVETRTGGDAGDLGNAGDARGDIIPDALLLILDLFGEFLSTIDGLPLIEGLREYP